MGKRILKAVRDAAGAVLGVYLFVVALSIVPEFVGLRYGKDYAFFTLIFEFFVILVVVCYSFDKDIDK